MNNFWHFIDLLEITILGITPEFIEPGSSVIMAGKLSQK